MSEQESENIERYLQLGNEILNKVNYLKERSYKFYDGGSSFEKCYSSDIEELNSLKNEWLVLHKSLLGVI